MPAPTPEWPETLEDALGGVPAGFSLRLDTSFNLLNSKQKLLYLTAVDPAFPRRKPVQLLPGPVVGDSLPELLESVASALRRVEEIRSAS
jgi:hypothetical protein